MFKRITLLFVLCLAFNTNAKMQKNIFIYFNAQNNSIDNIYILESSGLFIMDGKANLQCIILGKYAANQVIQLINDYNFDKIPNKFYLGNIKLMTYHLTEINYPDKYSIIDNDFLDLPLSINQYKIEYYDNYYDDNIVKGKIKSVGGVKIEYFKNYYLDEKIKGKVSKIGHTIIKLVNNYYEKKSIGLVKQIGNIKIKYSKSNYKDALNGLVIGIGNYKVLYFTNIYDKKHFGNFKKLTGTDNRFVLL